MRVTVTAHLTSENHRRNAAFTSNSLIHGVTPPADAIREALAHSRRVCAAVEAEDQRTLATGAWSRKGRRRR